MAVLEKRLEMTVLDSGRGHSVDGSQLVTALCQHPKALPPRFLYDSRGRALHERLAALPEYYMPRTARAVIKRDAASLPGLTGPVDIIELRAEDIAITRELLDAYRKPGRQQLYIPMVSDPAAVHLNAPSLLRQYPDLTIHALAGEVGSAIDALPSRQAPARLIVCLDNALGMIAEDANRKFLADVRRMLRPGDWFVAGVDLEAEVHVLEAAYNDSQGLTAALNLNALHQINRYYGGQINPETFMHCAFFNDAESRIELRLISKEHQKVRIPGLGFEFEILEGAWVLTEFSRKFTLSRLTNEFGDSGFAFVDAWADAKELYALFLFRAE